MKANLFVAESLLQVLCCMCLANSAKSNTPYQTLIINGRFDGADSVASTITDTALFNEVVLLTSPYEEYGQSGLSILWETEAKQKARFKRVLEQLTLKSGYDNFFFAGPNQLTRDIKRFCVNPNGSTALIDDGSGSHNGAIAKTFSLFDDIINYDELKFDRKERVKDFLKRICRRLIKDRGTYGVGRIYLFNPSERDKSHFRRVEITEVKCDKSLYKDVARVFGIKAQEGFRRGIAVYLSLPDEFDLPYKKLESEVLECLCSSGAKILFKPHPRRMSFSDVPADVIIDTDRIYWEASWMLGLFDETSVLIGMASTALLTPKVMFDKEPIVIFTHKLLKGTNSVNQDESYYDLKNRYMRKERVLAPTNLKELQNLIAEYTACGSISHEFGDA